MWRRHGQGRLVTGVPMVLVSTVQDVAQICDLVCPDQGTAIHNLGYIFQAFCDLDAVHVGVDGRKSADNLFQRHTYFEWDITFWVKGVWSGHAATHP